MVNLLDSIINNHIQNYVEKVSKKFNIPEKMLLDLWYNKTDQVIIYKIKDSKYYMHKDTGLVFDSPTQKR